MVKKSKQIIILKQNALNVTIADSIWRGLTVQTKTNIFAKIIKRRFFLFEQTFIALPLTTMYVCM